MARRIAALLRHGDYRQLPGAPSAHQPFPLTEAGEQQASEAAALLADDIQEHGWQLQAVIDSSCLLRGWQTARLAGEQLTRLTDAVGEVESFPAHAERGLGSAANMTFDRIQEMIESDPRIGPLPEGWRRVPEFRLPVQGAESLMQAGARVAARVAASIESIPEEWLEHDVSRDLKCSLGYTRFDLRGGEDLPDLLEGEIEIARVTLVDSVHGEVISLRARQAAKRIVQLAVEAVQLIVDPTRNGIRQIRRAGDRRHLSLCRFEGIKTAGLRTRRNRRGD